VDIEGSEGLRWSEGERSACCCCCAVSSRLADMLDGGWRSDAATLLHAHCFACREDGDGSCMRRRMIDGTRFDSLRFDAVVAVAVVDLARVSSRSSSTIARLCFALLGNAPNAPRADATCAGAAIVIRGHKSKYVIVTCLSLTNREGIRTLVSGQLGEQARPRLSFLLSCFLAFLPMKRKVEASLPPRLQ
jgi:hypothetical protein